MDRLGEAYRIPLLNIREGDVGVLVAPPIIGLFIGSSLGSLFALAFVLAGLAIGATIVYATPADQSAWAWLRTLIRYYLLRPKRTLSRPEGAEHPSTEGGWAEYVPFTPDERTQDLTAIERAWPGAGAIERDDGAMEAFLEVDPANMDFAMSDDWQSVQEAGETFANTELGFPLTVHATTRPFPAERLVDQLEERFDDSDVETAPALGELLEEYRDRRPQTLSDTRQHRYYLGVSVSPLEVYNRYEQERTPGEKLARIPILGVLFTPFVTRRENHSEAERRQVMFERLSERVRTVRTEFIEDVSGWSATRLSTLELFVLAAEFWNGETYDDETADRLLRKEPALHTNHGEDRR